MFTYGLWGSADNIAEVLTTRLNYFLIQRFAGLGSVGLLDAGTKISESVWHISRSVSFIEYSSVAQTTNAGEQKKDYIKTIQTYLLCNYIYNHLYSVYTGMGLHQLPVQSRIYRHAKKLYSACPSELLH